MSTLKPSIPKGTRDILPAEFAKRNYIFSVIAGVFNNFGYKPIETPAMELLSTLTGKYGDEGDRLIFKILNSGNFLSSVDVKDYEAKNTTGLVSQMCEKALRYDLTVPFARFVVQHRNDITFPFRRYQMQPVWRADKPQKGRYREFFQCDVDVIGSPALINEAELIKMTDVIFRRLNLAVVLKLNSRKILYGLAETVGAKERFSDFTTILDKIDKIGWDKVKKELLEINITGEAMTHLETLIKMTGSNTDKLNALASFLKASETGQEGVAEIREILSYAEHLGVQTPVAFEATLARGLNYYTGAIFEVLAADVEMGSLSGGGRYDNLTGIFGLEDVSGVGISYGADRIYDVMEELKLFPPALNTFSQVLCVNMGHAQMQYLIPLLGQLREMGIAAELYPDSVKMKKQMTYANKNNIPYVIIAGEDEMKTNTFTVKDMASGTQQQMALKQVLDLFKREQGAPSEEK